MSESELSCRVYRAFSRQLGSIRVECTADHLEILLKRDASHHHLTRYRIAWSTIAELEGKHYGREDGTEVCRYKINFKHLSELPSRIASMLNKEDRELRFEILDNPEGHRLVDDIYAVGAPGKIHKCQAVGVEQVKLVHEDNGKGGTRLTLRRASKKKTSVMVDGQYERGSEPITLRDMQGNIVFSLTGTGGSDAETGYESDYNPEGGSDSEGVTDDDYSTDGSDQAGPESGSDDETDFVDSYDEDEDE